MERKIVAIPFPTIHAAKEFFRLCEARFIVDGAVPLGWQVGTPEAVTEDCGMKFDDLRQILFPIQECEVIVLSLEMDKDMADELEVKMLVRAFEFMMTRAAKVLLGDVEHHMNKFREELN